MSSAINVALPPIGKEFSMQAFLLSWIATSYILSAAIFLVPIGKIADLYGRKKIFLYGVISYTFFSLLCGIATSSTSLIIFRVMQGIGSAMIFSTCIAILTSLFPAGERGKALGISSASTYLGLSSGPALGGFLTYHFGWRSIFFANIPFGLILIFLIIWKLDGEWAEARGEKFDYLGSIIYSIALMMIMFGFYLLPALAGKWLILLGIFGILFFIWLEMRLVHPVLHIDLFKKNKVFAFSNLAALISYCATAAIGFLLSLYLQYVKGLNPQTTGFILVAQPIMMSVFSPFAGKLSDKVEPRIVASIGMGLTVIGLLFFTRLNENTSILFIIFGLLILGLGFALFSSPNVNAIMSSVENKFYGVASAMLATMRLIGYMLSIGIAMFLFGLYVGNVEIKPEHYSNFLISIRVAFVVFAILCFGGIFASLSRGKIR